ncbi:MAG: RluA family pseudouridine synthase [Chlamydiia bacterium]|nr:RluA family pseudouridine synthase [Chlamydiia bacterium]
MLKYFVVNTPKRIDKLLAEEFPDYSRHYFQELIDSGLVICNGKRVKKKEVPAIGDQIQIHFSSPPEITLTAEDIPLEILYEDETIILVNKPVGMVVHPAPGHYQGTFVNALLHHCPSLPSQDVRPGIVHRLDKETSGVLLAAKTSAAHQKLTEAFSSRAIEKEYLAITVGTPPAEFVDAPIGRHPKKRKEMTVLTEGRHALTHFEVLESRGGFSLVKAKPVTGRTHQIRVHLKSLKTPILGDFLYGSEKLSRKMGVDRALLHAYRLTFSHPFSGKKMVVTAPFPQDFEKWTSFFSKNLD